MAAAAVSASTPASRGSRAKRQRLRHPVGVPVRVFAPDNPEGRAAALGFGDRILHHHLSAVEADDRFHHANGNVAIVLSDDGRRTPLGVAALSSAERQPGSSLPPWAMQLFLRPGEEERLTELVSALLSRDGTHGAEVWIRPEQESIVALIRTAWPTAFNCRRLHLMLADLPVAVDGLATRPLNPEDPADLEAVVRINNAAFGGHPDQAGMTVASVREKLAGLGHTAAGVRLAEIDGVINGFCWTQIHHERTLGEISVIGLHPDVHGRGLGGPMTAAGLHWLNQQGVEQCILYVEANNEPAVRSYKRLGFAVVHDDVSWMIPGPVAS